MSNVNRWQHLGIGLLGVLAGFALGTYWAAPASQPVSKVLSTSLLTSNLEPEDTYVNAVQFGLDLQRWPCIDTLFTREPFYRRAIRILWADSTRVEALSIPLPSHVAHYYLIRGDSVTQLHLSSRRARSLR